MVKRGTTNLGLRMEAGFGLLAWIVATALGSKDLPADYFTPHLRDGRAQAPASNTLDLTTATPEEAFRLMTKLAAQGRTPDPNKPKKKIRTYTPKKENGT